MQKINLFAQMRAQQRLGFFFAAGLDGGQKRAFLAGDVDEELRIIVGQIFRRLVTEEDKEKAEIPIPPQYLHDLIELLDEGKIKNNLLKSTLEKMLDTGKPASAFIREEDMGGVDDETLRRLCAESLAKNPKAGEDYKKGKVNAAKSLLGYVMKATRGRADAPTAEKILIELIENS